MTPSIALLPTCVRALVAWAVIASTGPASAAGETCLLEGEFRSGGTVTPLRDCMVNNGLGRDDFTAICKSIAEMGASLGAPPKVTHPSACPAAAQGSCDQVFGAPVRAYYYARTKTDLQQTRSSCIAQGGRWTGP